MRPVLLVVCLTACVPATDTDPVEVGDGVTDTQPTDTVDSETDLPDADDTSDTIDPPDTDEPPDTDDTVLTPTGDTGPSLRTADDILPGELLLTEILIESSDCPNDLAQYAELRFLGLQPTDLTGLQLSDNLNSWTFPGSYVVQPGETVLLWREPAIAGSQCYGFGAGIEWPLFIGLSSSNDRLTLANASGVLDEVDWTGWTIPSSGSMQLHPGVATTAGNDLESSWCPSTTPIVAGRGDDAGTPGQLNIACNGSVIVPPVDTGDTGGGNPGGPVVPGDTLVLSEVGDPAQNFQLRYVEIYNPTSQALDLSDYALERYSNGSGTSSGALVLGPGMLAPGDTWVVASAQASQGAFAALGGSFDQQHFVVDGNGDDAYVLLQGTTRVDVFGEVGATPGAWDYEDQVVTRDGCVMAGATVWSSSEWTFGNDGTASPGVHPPPGAPCGGVVVPGPTGDTGTGAVLDTTDTGMPVVTPPGGDTIVLSQVVDWGPNFELRFLELTNVGTAPASTGGLEIWRYANGDSSPNGTGTFAVSAVTLQPGESWVVGFTDGMGDFAATFGAEPDEYSVVCTGNGDDAFSLVRNGTVVDVYGVIGEDGTGEPWEYLDATATRQPVSGPSPVFDLSEWVISSAASAPTLGVHP
jgi:hypothetical protein